MPHHARTSGHRAYGQRHTFRIANCNIRETGLEAIRGALKIQQRHTETQVVAPPAFHLPERASVCCSAVPDQVRGLTARSTALLPIQSKEGLPAGIWSDRNEWCRPTLYAWGRPVSPPTFTLLVRRASVSAPTPSANLVFPSRIQKLGQRLFSSPSIPARHIRAQILKTKHYYYCCYFFMVEQNINVTNSCH